MAFKLISMKRIILVGCDSVALGIVTHSISSVVKQQIEVAIIEDKNQIEEIRNKLSEAEPIPIHNFHKEWIEPKIYDIPRSKYIGKPRNNFKKR